MAISYDNIQTKQIFFTIGLLTFGILALLLFLPYINVFILAFIIVQIFYPLYKFIYKKTKQKEFSIGSSVIIAAIVLILTIAIIVLLTYGEIRDFLTGNQLTQFLTQIQNLTNSVINFLDNIFKNTNSNVYINTVNFANINTGDLINSIVASLLKENSLPQEVISAGASVVYNSFFTIGNIILQFFLLLFSLIYLFANYERLPKVFNKVSPLDEEVNELLFDKFVRTVKGTIKGTFLVAIIQATVMLIPLILIGTPAPILLWLLMVLASLVPVGSGLIWVPIGVINILNGISSGNPTYILVGVLLLIYGAIAVNLIDTPLRSRLIKGTVDINPLITIFSILGGIVLFGIFGVLYGPLIVVGYTTIVEVFKKEELEIKEEIHAKKK